MVHMVGQSNDEAQQLFQQQVEGNLGPLGREHILVICDTDCLPVH
jgi:hypothetical protein